MWALPRAFGQVAPSSESTEGQRPTKSHDASRPTGIGATSVTRCAFCHTLLAQCVKYYFRQVGFVSTRKRYAHVCNSSRLRNVSSWPFCCRCGEHLSVIHTTIHVRHSKQRDANTFANFTDKISHYTLHTFQMATLWFLFSAILRCYHY